MSGPKCVGLSATQRELLRQKNHLQCDQLLARYRRREHEWHQLLRELERLGQAPPPAGHPATDELRATVDEAVRNWLDCDALNVVQHQLDKLETALAEQREALETALSGDADNANADASMAFLPDEAENDTRPAGRVPEPTSPGSGAGDLASLLQTWRSSRTASPEEDVWRQKLRRLWSQIFQLAPTTDAAPWHDKAAAVLEETDRALRVSRYENLVLDASRHVTQLRQRQEQEEKRHHLLDQLAPCESDSSTALRQRLAAPAKEAAPIDRAAWRLWQEQVDACLQEEAKRRQRESRRHAILESLREIGYEPAAPLQTAWVENGRLVMRKPDADEYAVEISTNHDAQLLQTGLLRFGDPDTMTRQQALRDLEAEEAWCRDHGELLAKLRDRGFENAFQFKTAPGDHPVRIVSREGDSPRRDASTPRERERP